MQIFARDHAMATQHPSDGQTNLTRMLGAFLARRKQSGMFVEHIQTALNTQARTHIRQSQEQFCRNRNPLLAQFDGKIGRRHALRRNLHFTHS